MAPLSASKTLVRTQQHGSWHNSWALEPHCLIESNLRIM
jgi:hypothetical protein